MPVEKLRALQLERMRDSLRNAYENVDFFKRSFAEAGVTPADLTSLEDLVKFPFVVKQDMRDAYPFGLFARSQRDVARIHASSGTTGQATVVGATKNDLKNWGEPLRSRYLHGRRLAGFDHSGGVRLWSFHRRPWRAPRRRGGRLHRRHLHILGNTKRQVQTMKDLGTDILACTPSYARPIADTAIEMGYDPAKDFKISGGIFGAEPASDNMRKEIAEKLGSTQHLRCVPVLRRSWDRVLRCSAPRATVFTSPRII